MGIFHEDQYTLLIIPRSLLLRMRNVSDKKVVKKVKTHTVCYFFFENRAFYGKMCKSTVQPDRPQMTAWQKRIT